MAHHRRRPSLLGALLWTGLGLLFLLHNLGIGPDFWSLVRRYWPVLLILLGLGKIIEYFLKKDAVSIRIGEIIGIVILLLVGTAITGISGSHFGRMVRDLPIDIGGRSMQLGESHTYTEEATFPLSSPVTIRVENAYGLVSVNPGSDREIRVRLRKVVYGTEERAKSIAAEIHLLGQPENLDGSKTDLKAEAEPQKSGAKRFVVRTNRDSLSSRDYVFNTDLEILVPKNSDVQVANSNGEVRTADINGKLDLSTTHRALELRNCTGEFNVSSKYAETRLTDLRGNLNAEGRHGRLYIENINGDVTVTNEYAPSEIVNIDGKLVVTSTEDRLRVEGVTKSVTIEARGTQVQVSDLKDSLKIKNSHRGLDVSNVAAGVTIESRYATLNLKEIKGSISIESNSDSINADDIGGGFLLKGRGSSVRANDIKGPLDIQTTLKEVVVNDFGDSCSITNEYAGISLSSSTLSKGDVKVKNRNGNVDVFLPEGASFSIDATARNGNVVSDYAGLTPTRDANTGSLKSKVKAGGPRITLETDYSDIHVYRTEEGRHRRSAKNEELSLRSKRILRPRSLMIFGPNRIGASL
jgi:hypothetical protein